MSDKNIGHLGLGMRYGASVTIRHGGETLHVKLTRHSGSGGDNARLIFEGPHSFAIVRDEADCKRDEVGPLSRRLSRAIEEAERRDRFGPREQ